MEMAWMLKPTIHLVVASYWTDLLCCLNGTLNPHKIFSMSLEFFTAPFQRSIWTVLDFNIGCLLQSYCCIFWDCTTVCIVLIAIFSIATILKRLFYVQWDDPSIFSEHTFQLQINMNASMFFPPIFLAMKPQLMCSCSTASFRNTNTCHVFVFARVFPLPGWFSTANFSRQICLAKIFAQIDVPMKVSANQSVSCWWNLWKGEGVGISWKFMGLLSQLTCLVLLLRPCAVLNLGQDMWMRVWLAFKQEYRFQCNELLICTFGGQSIQLQGFHSQNIFEAPFWRVIYPKISENSYEIISKSYCNIMQYWYCYLFTVVGGSWFFGSHLGEFTGSSRAFPTNSQGFVHRFAGIILTTS